MTPVGDDLRDAATASAADGRPGEELAFGVDDPDTPTEVTVYPVTAENVTTTWLTVDADHVLDLTEHA